jgi:hypothetical protein
MLNDGIPSVFSAIALPAASNKTHEKSFDSRTIGENDVRTRVVAASSAIAVSRCQTISRETGSSSASRGAAFIDSSTLVIDRNPARAPRDLLMNPLH